MKSERPKLRAMLMCVCICLSLIPACRQTEFEHLNDIPSKFVLTNFIYSLSSPFLMKGHFNSGSSNNGTDCAKVSGTIDWGDGIRQVFEEIPPCVTTDRAMPNWQSNPEQEHTYPGLGTYSMSAVLTAHFTNGAVTATLNTTIVVDK